MDEAIMVRRHLDMVELTQRRKLSAHGEAAKHRAIELQYLDGLFLYQRPAAIAGALALTRRERNARLSRQQLQLTPIIGPAYGFLQPAKVEWLKKPCRLSGRRKIPGTVDVDHQIVVAAYHLAHNFEPFDVFPERQTSGLGLERGVTLRHEHLHLLAQLDHILAITIVGAC